MKNTKLIGRRGSIFIHFLAKSAKGESGIVPRDISTRRQPQLTSVSLNVATE